MEDKTSKSVLVTGASSGIGNAIALHLANIGYTVIASVRKESDAEKLNSLHLKNLVPVCPLDLTSQDDIRSAVQTISQKINEKEIPPLHAMVLVAGGGTISPIELMDINAFRSELEKRLVGNITLLQGLLSELRKTKGCILWIATPGLFPVPYVADIHAPDFAVNYLARTLNLELLPDSIKNILIRCGGIGTPAPERTEKYIVERLSKSNPDRIGIYAERLRLLEQNLQKFAKKRTPPEKVAELIAKVLVRTKPKIRYNIGYMYVSAAQVHLGAVFNNGKTLAKAPFYIFRFKPLAKGVGFR